jgi:hypothetical protein
MGHNPSPRDRPQPYIKKFVAEDQLVLGGGLLTVRKASVNRM